VSSGDRFDFGAKRRTHPYGTRVAGIARPWLVAGDGGGFLNIDGSAVA